MTPARFAFFSFIMIPRPVPPVSSEATLGPSSLTPPSEHGT
ncbi:hypothetical protein OIE66_09085 [Nonomuraea sp. NBC_01738]|nr:hypothetical protein OIE66_09085 [Nonomuraea sp. NBC_01738]